jgi:hypothetical protein
LTVWRRGSIYVAPSRECLDNDPAYRGLRDRKTVADPWLLLNVIAPRRASGCGARCNGASAT